MNIEYRIYVWFMCTFYFLKPNTIFLNNEFLVLSYLHNFEKQHYRQNFPIEISRLKSKSEYIERR